MSEGDPKDMINLYKKLLVNQVDDEGNELTKHNSVNDAALWKSNFELNPEVNEYGHGTAEIIDFAVLDENEMLTSSIEKGTRFEIRSKVRFAREVSDPIFTYTLKDIHGTAITGTNTMYERVSIGDVKPGEIYVASFSQEMNLQGGEYLLSISCTGYDGGDFQAYHRLYDVLNITVVSDKNTVGFYDMNSTTTVTRVEQ